MRVTYEPGLPFPRRFVDESHQVWELSHYDLETPDLPISRPASAPALVSLPLPATDATYVWPFPGADEPLPGREQSIKTALEAYLEQGDHEFSEPSRTICVDHAAAALNEERSLLDLSQGRTQARRVTMGWVPPSLLEEDKWDIRERDGPQVYPCATMGDPEPDTPWVRWETSSMP